MDFHKIKSKIKGIWCKFNVCKVFFVCSKFYVLEEPVFIGQYLEVGFSYLKATNIFFSDLRPRRESVKYMKVCLSVNNHFPNQRITAHISLNS